MKLLIFDSGPLINLSMNGLTPIIEKLKQACKGKCIITAEVKQEVCDHPAKIPQFEWGAVRMSDLIEQKVLEFPDAVKIEKKAIQERTRTLLECANSSFKTNNKAINIVSDAEISCIAVAQLAKQQGHEPLLVIDERTARLLCEAPDNITKLLSRKLHRPITMQKNCVSQFSGLNCIRSSELVYVAQKKGLIATRDARALEALIYATKFKGAAISWDEINLLKKL